MQLQELYIIPITDRSNQSNMNSLIRDVPTKTHLKLFEFLFVIKQILKKDLLIKMSLKYVYAISAFFILLHIF